MRVSRFYFISLCFLGTCTQTLLMLFVIIEGKGTVSTKKHLVWLAVLN